MHSIWRIAGLALVAGMVLFLLSIIVKLLLVGLVAFALVRFVGAKLIGRQFGPLGRGRWQQNDIISIDNPAYRSSMMPTQYERVISIG